MKHTKLIWGVKESFRQYVEAAEGSITVADGADRNAVGSFVFVAIEGGNFAIAADGTASGIQQFSGTVIFEAHGGMLKSVISGLAIESGSEGITLSALEGSLNESRCHIAKLGRLEDSEDGVLRFSAEITLDGMFQIADNYPPGTILDDVILE